MTAYEKYLEYEKRIEELENSGKAKEALLLEDEQIDYRNNSFTKNDWENLIVNACSGRAKYEYTLMMNEKFPPEQK